MDHETACEAKCSKCKREDWECPFINIGCDFQKAHLCPKCDPTACSECGFPSYLKNNAHFYSCTQYIYPKIEPKV